MSAQQDSSQNKWQSATPNCSECQRPLIYDMPRDEWSCPLHGSNWSGPALAHARGLASEERCPTCGGRGWHTAGGNDPTACSCPAGEAWNG